MKAIKTSGIQQNTLKGKFVIHVGEKVDANDVFSCFKHIEKVAYQSPPKKENINEKGIND